MKSSLYKIFTKSFIAGLMICSLQNMKADDVKFDSEIENKTKEMFEEIIDPKKNAKIKWAAFLGKWLEILKKDSKFNEFIKVLAAKKNAKHKVSLLKLEDILESYMPLFSEKFREYFNEKRRGLFKNALLALCDKPGFFN